MLTDSSEKGFSSSNSRTACTIALPLPRRGGVAARLSPMRGRAVHPLTLHGAWAEVKLDSVNSHDEDGAT